jgi:hypothetical protein
MRIICASALSFVLLFAASAGASTHVGNRTITAEIKLPGPGWSASFDASSAPVLQTRLCGGSTWVNAPAYYVNGAFKGWNAAIGETCDWRLDLGGPFEVTVSNGQGVSITAEIDPAQISDSFDPTETFVSASNTAPSELWIGDADLIATVFQNLSSGSYTATSGGTPSLASMEAAFEVAVFEPSP